MTIAYSKLAMLQKRFAEQEEAAKIQGFSSCPIDNDLKERVERLLDKVKKY